MDKIEPKLNESEKRKQDTETALTEYNAAALGRKLIVDENAQQQKKTK